MPDDNKITKIEILKFQNLKMTCKTQQDVEDDMSDIFEDSDNMMITDEAIAVMAVSLHQKSKVLPV